jgi:hypothetical protein
VTLVELNDVSLWYGERDGARIGAEHAQATSYKAA